MIQFADKQYTNYLSDKEKQAIEYYYNHGQKDMTEAVKSAGYSQKTIYKVCRVLLNKPAAKEYLNHLKSTQLSQIDILTKVGRIANDEQLRPEVQLDALALLDKLSQKRTDSAKNEDNSACPMDRKGRLQWLTEQLKGYKAQGQAGLALAEEISSSIYAPTSGISSEGDGQ